MLTQGMTHRLTGYFLLFLLILPVAGCGGGGDGRASLQDSSARTVGTVARTGPILAVRVGSTANLSDNNSFSSSSEPLSFRWSFVSRPDGSNAVLQNATSTNPSFVADVRGTYRAQLVVSAGGLTSQRSIQLVVATIAPEPLTGPVIHQGLSSNCVICHDDEINGITPKVGNHVATSNTCETCHTPLGFTITPFVDHQEVFGNCSNCHNGVLAVGKSDFHVETNAECNDCHDTNSFFALLDGRFDHTGINSECIACHNGNLTIGKTPTATDVPPGSHPDTSLECINCHTTASFLGAFPDHSDPAVIGPGCDSCHGASPNDNISDPPVGHPVMTPIDCGYCHGIASFSLNGVFNHGLIDPAVMTCESCHSEPNSINARGTAAAIPTHPPTNGEDCGICHDTSSFANAVFDHSIPPAVGNRCDFCHGTTAIGKPADVYDDLTGTTLIYTHMPTTITNPIQTPPDRDCGDCHTPGTFATGTFDHDLSFFSPQPLCAECHNNVISLGKLGSHIPTTQDCGACHLDTIDFRGATVDHASLSLAESNNCASCHNGNIATGKQLSTHLPTALLANDNCFVCHNYPNTDLAFKDASNFSHGASGISDNCESCHGGNPDYVEAGAIGKKTNHIPALNQCDVCHDANTTNPGNFRPAPGFMPDVHFSTTPPVITVGCEGCHISRLLPLPSNTAANLVKDANHVPTTQDCYVCHSNAVGGFGQSTMLAHVGITGNCDSCHNGNFAAIGARAKTPTPDDTPAGTHPVTSADCALCHDTINFANAFVDHSDPAVLAVRCDSCHVANGTGTAKGTDGDHVATNQDCAICHVAGGSFAPAVFNHTNIVDDCASCHDTTPVTAKPKSGNHIVTSEDCSACHNTTTFAGAKFDHQSVGVNDTCRSCHNGNTTLGKPTGHMPTNGDCRDCHQTTGFKPATFDHVGIVDNCASCHDAGFATPKETNHVPTNQDCGVCHTPSTFKPASFDHTGITSNCESCHDGSNNVKGKIDAVPVHLSTSLDCYFCHSTSTFTGGSWTHDAATSTDNCLSCHGAGNGATPQSVGHLNTSAQCDLCHTTDGWAPTNFSHPSGGNYPGDHRRDPGCSGCHDVNDISSNIPWPWPDYAPFCAACHANDFDRKGDHIGGENGTIAQNKDCSGGGRGCHKVGDRDFD